MKSRRAIVTTVLVFAIVLFAAGTWLAATQSPPSSLPSVPSSAPSPSMQGPSAEPTMTPRFQQIGTEPPAPRTEERRNIK